MASPSEGLTFTVCTPAHSAFNAVPNQSRRSSKHLPHGRRARRGGGLGTRKRGKDPPRARENGAADSLLIQLCKGRMDKSIK